MRITIRPHMCLCSQPPQTAGSPCRWRPVLGGDLGRLGGRGQQPRVGWTGPPTSGRPDESSRNRNKGRNWAQASSSSFVCPHTCWALLRLSDLRPDAGEEPCSAGPTLRPTGLSQVLSLLFRNLEKTLLLPTCPACVSVCARACVTVRPFYSGAPRRLGWFRGPAPHSAPLWSSQRSRPLVTAHGVALQARCPLCPPGGERASGLKRQQGLGRHPLWSGEIRPRMKGSPGRLRR